MKKLLLFLAIFTLLVGCNSTSNKISHKQKTNHTQLIFDTGINNAISYEDLQCSGQ